MKKTLIILIFFAACKLNSQAPQFLNYQGVARNSSGNIISTPIGIKFEILQGSASGTLVYDETNNILPSSAGIFTTAIGSGAPGTGTFSAINWANSPYFIRVSIDPSGGTSYSTVGTSQLLSVPYALFAESTKPSTLSVSGNSLSINNGNSITLPAGTSYTAGNGISIVGSIITNTAPTATLIPAGISSITGTHPSFTIDVPAPALNYNTGTNVLTLTQGTAVATTTLVGAGSNTVSMYSSGIATVTPNGPGSNFTVSVQTPSFTSVGATSVTGTYPNFVINSPGASTTVPTSLQINSPHTTTTLSPNNFSINVAPTNISGPGVFGSYPNYTLAASPSTTITSGSSNVIVNGTSPSYTISATTPTIQINTPNTVTPLGLNNYSINVPPTNVGLIGVGVASVSGASPNYTIGVPSPIISTSGNTITVSQGTAVSTATFSGGPWAFSGGVLFPSASPTNDKVAIGQNLASANLDVFNSAASSNTIGSVVNAVNSNAAFNGNGVITARNNSGAGAVIFAQQQSTGDGISIDVNNASNGSNAVQVQHLGIGNAGYFSINNATSNGRVIDASTNGLGNVISAVNSNSTNTSAAIYGNTNGSTTMFINNSNVNGTGISINAIGNALYGSSSGSYHTFQAINTNAGLGIYAGYFNGGMNILGKGSNSSSFALKVLNSVSSDLFNVRNDGNVGINVPSPGYRLSVLENSASLAGIYSSQSYAASSSAAHGVYGLTSNTHTLAAGIYGENIGSGPGVFGNKTNGNGPAGRFDISFTTGSSEALLATNIGGGAAVRAVNGPTVSGGSNTALWLDNGHMKSSQATAPTTNSVSVSGGGISGVSITLNANSTDVKGTMNAVLTTTNMINSTNNAVIKVNFNKVYVTTPVVVVTALNDMGILNYYVSNVTTTSFNLTIRNSTATNMSTAASLPLSFNYIVIE